MKRRSILTITSTVFMGLCLVPAALCAQEKRAGVEIPKSGSEEFRLKDLAIGTDIEERKPIEVSDSFSGINKLACWMSIHNMGEVGEVTMVWIYKGNEINRHTIEVGTSKRWRAWSRQRVWKRGEWVCEVRDDEGKVLGRAKADVR